MPSGVPVATVGVQAGENAALLAVQILGVKYPELAEALSAYKSAMQDVYKRQVMPSSSE